MYMAEVADAIFQDSGWEFGGDASDSDFEDSQADNSDFQAGSPSKSANSEPEPEHTTARPTPVRHPRNCCDRQTAQIEWEVYEDIDPYESVWLQDYNERQGILVDTTNFTLVDFFYLFVPEAAFELQARMPGLLWLTGWETSANTIFLQTMCCTCDVTSVTRDHNHEIS